jgi:hypothetical protein
MKKGFNKSEQEVFEQLKKDEEVMTPWFESEFKTQFRSQACAGLMHHFDKDFQKDDDGHLKNWPELDEGKIKDDFKASQQRTLALLDEFRTLNIPMSLTVLQSPSQDIQVRDNSSRATTIPGANILSADDLKFVKEKLEAEMILALDDALFRHVSEL